VLKNRRPESRAHAFGGAYVDQSNNNLRFTKQSSMDETLGIDSKPSSLNILKKFYRRVTRLDEYLRENVSDSRFARITAASQQNAELMKLLNTSLVCFNPKFLDDDDNEMDNEISILSVGEHVTQSEVQ
jgi:hypothetical protein